MIDFTNDDSLIEPLEKIIKIGPSVMYTLSKNGSLIYCNKNVIKLLGNLMEGSSLLNHIYPEDLWLIPPIRKVLYKNRKCKALLRIIDKNNKTRWYIFCFYMVTTANLTLTILVQGNKWPSLENVENIGTYFTTKTEN